MSVCIIKVRKVHKVLFRLKLWLPRRLCSNNYLRHRPLGLRPESSEMGGDGSHTADPNVNNNGGRSGRSPPSVSAACLNGRSIKNKTPMKTLLSEESRPQVTVV